jgi:hypothetical protein
VLGAGGLLAAYLILLFLLRTREAPLISTQRLEQLKKDVEGAWKVLALVACISGVVVVIAFVVGAWRNAADRQHRAQSKLFPKAAFDPSKPFELLSTNEFGDTFSIDEILGPDPAAKSHIVEIPGIGSVEFPASMSTGEIAKAAGMLYSNRSIAKRDIFDDIADAQKTLVTGTWTWSAQGGATSVPARKTTLKLIANGEKLTGTLTPPPSVRGGAQPLAAGISDGRITGNEIWFSIRREFNGNTFVTKYSGKVDGSTILGKIETPGRNGGVPLFRDWEAKREK